MNLAKVSGLVELAANTLAELASELRRLSNGAHYQQPARRHEAAEVRAGDEDDAAWEGLLGTRVSGGQAAGDLLARLRAFWDGVSMAPVMTCGESKIDLGTPSGRWELLALAVLLGARVSNRVVERTFAVLRGEGLLDLESLAYRGESLRPALEEVFRTKYHALGNKASKINALVDNARQLVDMWDGDLHAIYLAAKGASGDAGEEAVDEERLIRTLQEFKHIKQLAFWVCRTLKAHGIWKDLGPWATGYHDRYTRLPLERLEIVHEAPEPEAAAGVMAMYLQGFNLCSQDDVTVCLTECPVAAWCPYARRSEQSE